MPDGAARPRVFLFGLDGATFTLLRPWAEEGHLPAFARLMRDGAWGPLASTIPAVTPIAWNSMVTGVYPGKHGVFGFVKRRPDSYELEFVTSRDRRRPAIWNLLDQAGLRSIIVDVPFTYPPEPINGIMISGLGTPDVMADFIHPRPLREVIFREFGPYPLDVHYRGDVLGLLEDARRLTDHRLALTRFLAREYPWDFLMLGLMTPDRLQHVVWRYLDEGHSRYDVREATRYRPAILDYYRRIDEVIAELLAEVGPQTVFLIASDHGFGPMERGISLLRWLGQQGSVALGGRCWQYAPPAHPSAFSPRGPGRVIERVGGDGLTFVVEEHDAYAGAVFRVSDLDPSRRYELRATVVDATPGALLEFDDLMREGDTIIGGGAIHERPTEVSAAFQPSKSDIDLFVGMTTYNRNPCGHIAISALTLTEREDWARSVAYMLDRGPAVEGRRIRLNVRGREPQGIVEMGEEYDRLREHISAGLLALRDDAGLPVVSRVYRREELYAGPHVEEGPDLVVVFADDVAEFSSFPGIPGNAHDGPITFPITSGKSGNHRREGIFLACGEAISRGKNVAADIVDLAPTVLHLLGLPIPRDVDGRVLDEILTQDPRSTPTAAAGVGVGDPRQAAEETPLAGGPAEAYSQEDRQKVEDRLRRLGYIE